MEMAGFLSLLIFFSGHIGSERKVNLKQPSVGDLGPQISVQFNVVKKGEALGIKKELMLGA